MTYTRSGNALATSSTLLKYCTGSFISRSCSSSLNCPEIHDKRQRCEMFTLDSCHCGDSISFPSSHSSFSNASDLYHSSTRTGAFLRTQLKNEHRHVFPPPLFLAYSLLPEDQDQTEWCSPVIWSQSEHILLSWSLILFFAVKSHLLFSGNIYYSLKWRPRGLGELIVFN